MTLTGVGYHGFTTESPSGGSLLPTRPPEGAPEVLGNTIPSHRRLAQLLSSVKQQAGSAAFLLTEE
jgi:hypothetical protein